MRLTGYSVRNTLKRSKLTLRQLACYNVVSRRPMEGNIHRVTVTYFRSICMPAGFRRHFVGKTLTNVFSYSDTV